MEFTPADGPLKVGEERKEGKRSTKGQKRQTDRDNKEKEVLWCLVYIPQPSFLKYSKISNLYNQMSANNPPSRRQRVSQIPGRCCRRFPMETEGARWQFRAKQILQIMCWAQWHTGSRIAPKEMTKGKIKHLRGLQRGGQLDGKTFPGQIYHKMKSRRLRVELDE